MPDKMRYQRIIRHGHSLAVAIPIQWCRDLDFKRGDNVELSVMELPQKDPDTIVQVVVIKKVDSVQYGR